MGNMARHEEREGLSSETIDGREDVERVEVEAGFRVAFTVPFTPEQSLALQEVARERETDPIEAVRYLVDQALTARAAR
jgi:hypothetical protein